MKRLGRIVVSLLLLWLIGVATPMPAVEPVVGRSTVDRDADLIEALIRGSRYDDALSLCQAALQSMEPDGQAAAKWLIRQTAVQTAQQLESETFDTAAIERLQAPIEELLSNYPDHPRRLFLRAAQVDVLHQAARSAALVAAVWPAGGQPADRALQRLLSATTATVQLADQVAAARAGLDRQQRTTQFAIAADLTRLEQSLRVDVVSLAVMQTDLFAAGSPDRIAAATKAEQAADAALTNLPTDTDARREVNRLRIEAILRGGQASRAESELSADTTAATAPLAANRIALRVRIALAQDRLPVAAELLAAYYDPDPLQAPPSIEMDLARLEYLIAADAGGQVGPWLDAMQQRGGVYARRRGEAIALEYLRQGSATATVEPSLVAAQGQDWLRRGNAARAAELLAVAARAELDDDRAVRYATEAAAAWQSVQRNDQAADVLAEIATAHPAADDAAALHLTAAVMISQTAGQDSGDVDVVDRTEQHLRKHLDLWPAGGTTASARQWLVQLLAARQRPVEAAEVASMVPPTELTTPILDELLDRWRTLFVQSPAAERLDLSQRFQTAFAPLRDHPLGDSAYRRSAALWLERDLLAGIPDAVDDQANDPFLEALLRFRQQGSVSPPLQQVPTQWIDDASWRLMADGRSHSGLRPAIAQLLDSWHAGAEPSLASAERMLWLGRTDQATQLLQRLTATGDPSGQTLQQAARLLTDSSDAAARQAAIAFWDRLASGSGQGSPSWHQAKLAAIGLLHQLGRADQASQRAEYILLTSAAIPPQYKSQYESFANSAGQGDDQ